MVKGIRSKPKEKRAAQTCKFCKNHQSKPVFVKGHKCPYKNNDEHKKGCKMCKKHFKYNEHNAERTDNSRKHKVLTDSEGTFDGIRQPRSCVMCTHHKEYPTCTKKEACKFNNHSHFKVCNYCKDANSGRKYVKNQIKKERDENKAKSLASSVSLSSLLNETPPLTDNQTNSDSDLSLNNIATTGTEICPNHGEANDLSNFLLNEIPPNNLQDEDADMDLKDPYQDERLMEDARPLNEISPSTEYHTSTIFPVEETDMDLEDLNSLDLSSINYGDLDLTQLEADYLKDFRLPDDATD